MPCTCAMQGGGGGTKPVCSNCVCARDGVGCTEQCGCAVCGRVCINNTNRAAQGQAPAGNGALSYLAQAGAGGPLTVPGHTALFGESMNDLHRDFEYLRTIFRIGRDSTHILGAPPLVYTQVFQTFFTMMERMMTSTPVGSAPGQLVPWVPAVLTGELHGKPLMPEAMNLLGTWLEGANLKAFKLTAHNPITLEVTRVEISRETMGNFFVTLYNQTLPGGFRPYGQ